MRFVGMILGYFAISIPSCALGQNVTIMQLRDFLLDQHKSRYSDQETASRLSLAALSEQLTDQALSRIITETMPGPESVEQLRLLADESIFVAPLSGESLSPPSPSLQAQQSMVRAGTEYAQGALQHLPNFLAIRHTRRFDNTPQKSGDKHAQPKIQLHWAGEFKNEIAFRNGTELPDNPPAQHMISTIHDGFTSNREFGPILLEVVRDFGQGGIAWARWEIDPKYGQLAVFHYAVPKSASHYLVDFCCYIDPESSANLSFRDFPAYHGEVVLNPESGVIRRITIQADLDDSALVLKSNLAVEYGTVEIGGQAYVCPVRSIATTALHNPQMKRIDGIGIERHLNEVQYIDYHKFGSTHRIVATP